MSLRAHLKQVTPGFMKAFYCWSRLALRATVRTFRKVADCYINGMVIHVGVASEIEQYRAEHYATKEPEIIEWLNQNLRDHDVFFDVGANIGLYSLYAAKLKATCAVYAFEPESQNFSRLCKNIVLNKLGNIVPCGVALSDQVAFDLFNVYDLRPGSALHSLGELSGFRLESDAVVLRQGVISITLDAMVTKYGLPQPSLLKIDVDGIEEKILDGAEVVLKSERLRSIMIEVTFKAKDEGGLTWAERKLTRLGYQLERKSDWIQEVNGLRCQNYIFCR